MYSLNTPLKHFNRVHERVRLCTLWSLLNLLKYVSLQCDLDVVSCVVCFEVSVGVYAAIWYTRHLHKISVSFRCD